MILSRKFVVPALKAVCSTGLMTAFVGSLGCGTMTQPVDRAALESAQSELMRPVSGDPAALYRLRLSSSGGLRLALLTSGREGRLTVSEPFGSAVSITSWNGSAPPDFFDLRAGCRLEAAGLSQALGIGALPLPQAVKLLSGRLPVEEGDAVSVGEDGRLLVTGRGWSAYVELIADPWRVASLEDAGSKIPTWRLVLSDHSSSVPGIARIEKADGRWAELELVRLEWNDGASMPLLPALPLCVEEDSQP